MAHDEREHHQGAERSLDRFLVTTSDARPRRWGEERATVAELAEREPLMALPVPYPAVMVVERVVTTNATVHYRGNRYSTPPGLSASSVTLLQRLGGDQLEINSTNGSLLATHRPAHDGTGMVVRDPQHGAALERVVLSQFTTQRPCHKKAHVGVKDAALHEAARLPGRAERSVSVDLEHYARPAAS